MTARPYIHKPPALWRRLSRRHCPACGKRRFMIGWLYKWYGWYEICLRCGEQWQDGEMLPRPFMPRWRRKNIDAAKRRWREGR